MPFGKLILTIRTGRDSLPATSFNVRIIAESGATIFDETSASEAGGVTRSVDIEAPPAANSLDSANGAAVYSLVSAVVVSNGFYRMRIVGIQIFDGRVAQLPVDLIPLPENIASPQDAPETVIRIPEHSLTANEKSGQPLPESDIRALPAVAITEGVYIPATITVHLGEPDSEAENVTVAFVDYIKNVASSEIYPTWPEQSLRANIIAQISLTLNRVYTEWYRSRDYDFDITNTTAYDQAFVYGRNIYTNINDLVDDIFNLYITRPYSVEPLFAQYCNGTTSTCAGMSQWGTVALAESGLTSSDILAFYYGDIKLNETRDIRELTESYPGTPISAGDVGRNVLVVQEQLNRIAINFPEIPLNRANSTYDENTVNAVRTFQRLFLLPENGITDKATWYRISYVYASVKRLAQITSEGQRPVYNEQLYPGYVLRLNVRGSGVQEIQFYLYRISFFNPAVLPAAVDGIYGQGTANAVASFQRVYGLPETGEVDETTWYRIVEIYNGTVDNVEEPPQTNAIQAYPGIDLSLGMNGPSVVYIQERLNEIRNVFALIPEVATDGVFNSSTETAVNAFAQLFGYPVTGVINEALWNKINRISAAVSSQCIFGFDSGTGTRPFPGADISEGASGENVRYVQTKINTLYTAIPYVGQLIVDGIFGINTKASVAATQFVFGLTASGIVNETTWSLLNQLYLAVVSGCLPVENRTMAAFAYSAEWHGGDTNEKMSHTELKKLLHDNGIEINGMPLSRLRCRIALARWQNANNLEPTGKPDSRTLELLRRGAQDANKT